MLRGGRRFGKWNRARGGEAAMVAGAPARTRSAALPRRRYDLGRGGDGWEFIGFAHGVESELQQIYPVAEAVEIRVGGVCGSHGGEEKCGAFPRRR